jgi:hypothetical protein
MLDEFCVTNPKILASEMLSVIVARLCFPHAGSGTVPIQLSGGPMRLKLGYIVVTVAMLFCLSISLERRAYAYVDPGSGLLILQGIGTVLTGVLFTLRRRIKMLFTRSKPAETVPSAGAPSTEI